MRWKARFSGRALVPTLGVVLGIAAAVTAIGWSTAVAGPAGGPGAVFEATHLPPLLTTSGERIDLAYDVHCAAAGEEVPDAGCEARGTAYVRGIGGDSFTALPLEERSLDGRRQLAVVVPDALAAPQRGLEYFAVLEAPDLGRRLVVPAGGAAAPHVSRQLDGAVEIGLGRHTFGSDGRPAGVRVASAEWGDGATNAGLEQSRGLGPIGASSFDVDSLGNVLVLDQAHRRVLRWVRGSHVPQRVPISINGTLADLAVAGDGSIFVLETTAPPGRNPMIRRFDDGGRELEAIETAERSTSQIRMDAESPVVLGGSSHLWMPVMVAGTPASPGEQLRRGRVGRRPRGGTEVIVLRHENEVRIAVVDGRGVARSWRLTSGTPLAEIQLAEPVGQQVVLVVRVYDGARDEFVVLILGRIGLVDRFPLDSADWAETMPLGRFRLVGRSLYRLGSTPSGAFVDRFDLEVR